MAAAFGWGVEVVGFVSNPTNESGHFRVFTQRLDRGEEFGQCGFSEQSMNLPVTDPVHQNRDDPTPRFGHQMVCILESRWDRSIAKHAERQLGCLIGVPRGTCLRLQTFDSTLSHGGCGESLVGRCERA